MSAADIIRMIAILGPLAMEAGVNIAETVQRFNDGTTLDELIAEVQAKRDDLPDLAFVPLW